MITGTSSPVALMIYGAGGHGREMLALIQTINAIEHRYEIVGWLDDRIDGRGEDLLGFPVYGSINDVSQVRSEPIQVIVAIGSPAARRRIAQRLAADNIKSPALVHPSASIGARVKVQGGSMICAGSVLTCDITIGAHVIVNAGATVSHDCGLEDYATIAPGCALAGAVNVREGADIGIGASVLPGVEIGPWSIVGAGSCVTKRVPNNTIIVGVPGRAIRTKEPGWHEA